MPIHKIVRNRAQRGILVSALALITAFLAQGALAQSTWEGDGGGTNATDYFFDDNWSPAGEPVAGGTALFNGVAGGDSDVVDLGGGVATIGVVQVNSIGTIQNGTFSFSNGGLAGVLEYNDADNNALASDIILDIGVDGLNIVATTPMTFAGSVLNGSAAGATLTLDGPITLNGPISDGSETVAVTVVSGTAELGGINTYTGATTVNSGATLNLQGGLAINDAGSVVVNGTMNLLSSETIGSLSGTDAGATVGVVGGTDTLIISGTSTTTYAGVLISAEN